MDKSICYLSILLVVIIYLSLATFSYHNNKNQYMIETFSNNGSPNSPGNYPASEDGPLLSKHYLRKTVSDNNTSDIWWHFPIFKVGSFAQVTNNLKYRRNPDDGTCIRADFCGALYNDDQLKTNISEPLPPAPLITGSSTRVNYYTTNNNLFMGQQDGPELQTF